MQIASRAGLRLFPLLFCWAAGASALEPAQWMLSANLVFHGSPAKGLIEQGLASQLPPGHKPLLVRIARVLWSTPDLAPFAGREVVVAVDATSASAAALPKSMTRAGPPAR